MIKRSNIRVYKNKLDNRKKCTEKRVIYNADEIDILRNFICFRGHEIQCKGNKSTKLGEGAASLFEQRKEKDAITKGLRNGSQVSEN